MVLYLCDVASGDINSFHKVRKGVSIIDGTYVSNTIPGVYNHTWKYEQDFKLINKSI